MSASFASNPLESHPSPGTATRMRDSSKFEERCPAEVPGFSFRSFMPALSDDSAEQYCRRRNRDAGALCSRLGFWSGLWFKRAVDWDDHIKRRRLPYSWPVLLGLVQDQAWLMRQRAARSFHGTGTRSDRGRPQTRWENGVQHGRLYIELST